MKIAAVQLNAAFADVKTNLEQCRQRITEAARAGASLVLLPEFFTSAIGFAPQMLDVAVENQAVPSLLKQWAREIDVIIGGSYIAFDGENAYNKFELVFPNGDTFTHKKDIPTQFENCFYTEGDQDNILQTPIGNIGVALCWEMIRYDTAKRLCRKAVLVLSGSCWWDLPVGAPAEREPLRQYNQALALDTPAAFAKLVGVPLIHANHCGEVTALTFPNADRLQTRHFVGAAQIVDGNGTILTRKLFSEGAGFVLADIAWSSADNSKAPAFPERYWIPDLPDSYLNAWETVNPLGRNYYQTTALPYYKTHSKLFLK